MKKTARTQISLLVTISLLCLFLAGCNEDDQSLLIPTKNIPVKDADPVAIKLQEPVWNAYYQLPSNWHINLDYPNKAKRTDSVGAGVYLEVSKVGPMTKKSDLQTQAEGIRDSLAPCLPKENDGIGRNCQKTTTILSAKFNLKSKALEAVILRYFGTWQDRLQEVNEIFLEQDGQIISISLQGSLKDNQKSLELLLSTLTWKLEPVKTGQALEPEEKGL